MRGLVYRCSPRKRGALLLITANPLELKMKPFEYARIAAAAFSMLLLPTIVHGQVSDSLSFNSSQFSFSTRNTYNVIDAKGFRMSSEVGYPSLPMKIVTLAIPTATDVESITINDEAQEALTGTYHVYPSQPPVLITPENSDGTGNESGFISPNSAIYGSSSPYPANPVKVTSTSYFDGTRIVQLAVSPFGYSPSSGRLNLITHISFTLNLQPSSDKPIHVYRRSLQVQNQLDKILRHMVDNPQDIQKYQQRPDALYSTSVGATNVVSGKQETFSTSSVTYATYMIITSSSLAPAFQAFIDQKQADGIDRCCPRFR